VLTTLQKKERLLISAQHQELLDKYQQLVLRQMQHDAIVKKKDDQIHELSSQITPLRNAFDEIGNALKELQTQYTLLVEQLTHKDKQLDRLLLIEHQYEQLKKLLYGRSSEKSTGVSPEQLLLNLDAELVEACNMAEAKKVAGYTKYSPTNTNHPGRNKIPAHVPRVYVDLHPENLPEGAQQFDKEETEQLEYDPAKLFATVYRRYKYKLQNPDGSVQFFIAPLPEEKDKCLAAPSLKAHVTVEKYMYHMPIYRLLQRFAQDGIVISDTTMGDWINNTCYSLTAVYDALRKDIVFSASKYMMADETAIMVLDKEKAKGKKSHIGYMWAYCNPVDKLVFFEYQGGRGNKHAKPVLDQFRGKLHTEGIMCTSTMAIVMVLHTSAAMPMREESSTRRSSPTKSGQNMR
jgi:transposase